MWGFESVRIKAIGALEADATVDMIERLKLANEFQITNWIRPAYQYLMTRVEELKEIEVPWLGDDFVQNVTKAREERRKLYLLRVLSRDLSLPRCPSCAHETLKLNDFTKSSDHPQAGSGHRGSSMKWTLQCGGQYHRNTYPLMRYSWTFEELVHVEYAKTSTNPLMGEDVDRLIDLFFPPIS